MNAQITMTAHSTPKKILSNFDLENIVVVTSSDLFGRLPRHSNYGMQSVDIMVSAEQVEVFDHRGAYSTTGGSSYAAPMLAALATVTTLVALAPLVHAFSRYNLRRNPMFVRIITFSPFLTK